MPERRCPTLIVDNRRNRSKPFPQSAFLQSADVLSPKHITDITPGNIDGYDLIALRGGDGTTGYILNALMHIDGQPALLLEGGGSANTLLKGLRTTPQVAIPQDLTDVCPPDSFEAHLYRPPQIISDKGVETTAYLVAPDHLTVDVTKHKEKIGDRLGSVHLSYIVSGLISLLALKSRVAPGDITPSLGINQEKIAAAASIAVPILGTFKLLQSIDPNKLRLLSISAHTEYGLLMKYASILLVASSFPNGADTVIKLGLMHSKDVDRIAMTPDPHHSPNICIDGELRSLRGRIEITRSPQGRLIIIPKH